MAPYDVLGNIALVKFPRDMKLADKKKFGIRFLKENKPVRTVLEKSDKIKGRLRTPKTKWIAGENTKEALYRENGCEFRLNVDTCYFSPRLSSERKEIAELVKRGERVLVMFGGVAPFAIVIGKFCKDCEVTSVELGREPSKYALENVKRNKLKNVKIVQGDVKRQVPKLGKFDRIVMARPNLKDSFLGTAFSVAGKGSWIHYYGFYPEEELDSMKELIVSEAKKARRKIKITRVKKAVGSGIGVRRFRYRADLRVFN